VAHNNIAYLLVQRGNHAEAAKHFAKATRIDPTLKQAQDGLAMIQKGTPERGFASQNPGGEGIAAGANRITALPPLDANTSNQDASRAYSDGSMPAGWQAPVAHTADANTSRYNFGTQMPVGSRPQSQNLSTMQPLPPVSPAIAPY
jgi:hypothetical protein